MTAPETEDRLGLRVRLYSGNADDNRANSRLIAAAPDLLLALREAEFAMDNCAMVSRQLTDAIKSARAAIAKATGQALVQKREEL